MAIVYGGVNGGATSGPTYGCTDPLALNYDPAVNTDDGTCDYGGVAVTPVYNEGITLSFSEVAKGWTSFKSFVQDSGLSLNNDYYTFKNTTAFDAQGAITSSDFLIWKHHNNEIRNNFYNQQYDSHVDVLFNEESATVKSFASMKYEGSQSKITEDLTDPAYFNNEEEKGWYVESGITDLQLAGEMEFKDKEGKWFSYMKGVAVRTVKELNSKEFSFQGIGILEDLVTSGNVFGCTDPIATNYDPTATDDDGNCTYPPYSCWGCELNDDQELECQEDTDPLNGPCTGSGKYVGLSECETLTNYCTVPPASLYTLTINDVAPSVQQIHYSVSTFTKTGIPGDSFLPYWGSGGIVWQTNAQGFSNGVVDSEYKLEISADAGYTVRASDFGIEFPNGTFVTPAGLQSYVVGGYSSIVTPYQYWDDWMFSPSNTQSPGQGNDLGTGPLVPYVSLQDSENPTHDENWVGPSGSNKVIINLALGTDMQDNIPGVPSGTTWDLGNPPNPDIDVYMTHNGMSSGNLTNTGIPGDLNININLIGSAQTYATGCTDPYAVNYGGVGNTGAPWFNNVSPPVTIDDGSCTYGGCMDPYATNYNALATTDDGSCTYPTVCGCTDNTSGIQQTVFASRPIGYFGPAENYNSSATAACESDCAEDGCVSGQTGIGCCCTYDFCNVIVQSMDGVLTVTNSNNVAQNNGSCVINLGQPWVPAGSKISINVYTGNTGDEVTGLHSIFWNASSTAAGWGDINTNSNGTVYHQNNSYNDPTGWHTFGDLPPGDYHVRIDTDDACHVWYDFTIGDDYTNPPSVYGCTDACGCNYNSLATVDDGTCILPDGCTDYNGYNYDPYATCEDGSCCYDLTPTFTIVGDTTNTSTAIDSNGSIKMEIPNSYAAGGVPQFDVNGNPMQIKMSVRYYTSQVFNSMSTLNNGGNNPWTNNNIPGTGAWYGWECAYFFCYGGPSGAFGFMAYNTTTDTWTLGNNYNNSISNNPWVYPINTNQYIMEKNVGYIGYGAIGGYAYGATNGWRCPTTPDANRGYGSTVPTGTSFPENITNADWTPGANYLVTVMYRTTGGGCGGRPWCKKRFYLYVPCV